MSRTLNGIYCLWIPLILQMGWLLLQAPQGIPGVTGYSDSLVTALEKPIPDSAKIRIQYLLADYWSDRDSSKAFYYVREGLQNSRSDPFLNAIGYFYLAGNYFSYDGEKSANLYLKADSLLQPFTTPEAYVFRSRAWHNYGALQQAQDDEYAFADILLNKAIPFAQMARDSVRVGKHYLSLGIILTNQVNYDRSIEYLRRAEAIFEQHPADDPDRIDLYLKFARNYIFKKQPGPVPAYLQKTKKLLAKDRQSHYWPEYYLIEGMYHQLDSNYSAALTSFDQGIRVAEEVKREEEVAAILFQKYRVYRAQKKYRQAVATLETVMKGEDEMQVARNRLLHYFHMAETQALLHNYSKAYDWLLKFTVLADSAKMEQTTREVAALEARYQSSEKERQILLLQSKNEKAELTIRNNKLFQWLLGTVSVFLLVLAALLFFFYRNTRKLMEHQQQVHTLELHKLKQEQRILQLSAILEGQEQERTRLARDLHDGLGGLLSGIKIELSEKIRHAGNGEQFQPVIGHLDAAVNELRRIARSLMPEILTQYGLTEAVREFCKSLSIPTGPAVVCQVFNYQGQLPAEKEVVLYRIIQELVNNAVKHARASQILVVLQQRDAILYVTVEDNGIGFKTDGINHKVSSGIASIQARSEFLQGELAIHSSPGNGTTVTLECPV